MATETDLVEFCSQEWCNQAMELWEEVVIPNLADPPNYNYVVEWKDTDSGAISQFKAEKGIIQDWEPGKRYPDEECDFILWAKRENWQKIANGTLDPVGAVASKRVHLRKGPMAIVIKEANAFKLLLIAYGRIPTAW